MLPKLKGKEIANLEDTLNASTARWSRTPAPKLPSRWRFTTCSARNTRYRFTVTGGYRNQVETDLTISVNSPEEMARDSRIAIDRGFRILKLKVGLNPALDIERIMAVKEACGPMTVLRLDANQGWSARDAVKIMHEIESEISGIELLEQPVLAHDLEGLRMVKESIETPVLADEAVFSAIDAEKIISMGAADYINIKLMKTGGLRGAMRICARRNAQRRVFLGCMMETKISVTAAAHLACARSIITRCDLDSPPSARPTRYTAASKSKDPAESLRSPPRHRPRRRHHLGLTTNPKITADPAGSANRITSSFNKRQQLETL